MIGHLAFVICDRCGATSSPQYTAVIARAQAEAGGWERRNWNIVMKDFCPPCAQPRARHAQ